MTPQLLAALCAGIVLLRASLPAHAPALVDAHAAAAACALVFIVPAPRVSWHIAALVVLAPVLSLIGSWDPWVSLLSLPVAIGAAAFFMLGAGAAGAARTGLLVGLAAAGTLNALTGLVQRAVLYPQALADAEKLGLGPTQIERLRSARPLGLSLSPDLAGAISLMGLFAAAALLAQASDRRARALGITAATASLVGVLLSRSAGTALGLVLGLAVAAALLGDRRRLAVGLLGALVPLGAVVALRGADALLLSVHERLLNYRAAFAIFLDAPVFGVGVARFAPAYAQFREPGANVTRYAHSAWAQGLAETGLVGAVLACAALVLVLRALRTAPRTPAAALLLGGVAASFARASVDYDLQVGQTAALVGLLVGLAVHPGIQAAAMPAPAPGVERPQRLGAATMGLFVLGIAVVLFIREGVLRTDPLSPVAVQELAARAPHDVEAQLAQARFELDGMAVCSAEATCDALARAARARLDALCARPRPPSAALLLRARLRMRQDDAPGALDDVDHALRLDPGNDTAHRMGVALAAQLERDVGARLGEAARWGVAVTEP